MKIFPVALIAKLAAMPDDEANDIICEEANTWVSENEGYNSIEFDLLCEKVEEEIWEQVFLCRELTSMSKEAS